MDYNVNVQVFTANLRFNYHILYNKKIDLYIGGGTGLREVKEDQDLRDRATKEFSGYLQEFELSLGARYFPYRYFGFYVEAGMARAFLQAGFCASLK